MNTLLLVVLLIVMGAVFVHRMLSRQFARRVAAVEAGLVDAPPPVQSVPDLPPLVEAFARRGLAGGQLARGIALTQSAEMRLSRGAKWQAVPARQVISTGAPGFLWLAEMRVGPVRLVRVIDFFSRGSGRLEVRALSAFRMGLAVGPEADIGEAMRYLAELPWAPDAILGNPALRWRQLAPDRVEVATDTNAGEARVTLIFDATGDITSMEAHGRPAAEGKGFVPRDWVGEFFDYGMLGPRRVPRSGEVGWVYDDGYETYFRGRFDTLEVL